MHPGTPRGRGVPGNPGNRFERLALEPDPDAPQGPATVPTLCYRDASRTIISRNDSPDIPFEVSLNPYRGCEHGCVYCYARPTHEYLGFSCGLDFETRLLVKESAPALLRDALAHRGWMPRVLAMSGVTDPYQPVERQFGVTRGCLEVLAAARHPVAIVTKGALVTRDLDLLAELAVHGAASVSLSLPTLDESLRRTLEPRAPAPDVRLDAMTRLREAGVPVGVMVAPVIPGLTDHEVPAILARAAAAGATFAGYVMLRLPHGVKALFADWLARHHPDRRQRVLSRVGDLRGGRLDDPRFGARMRGEGPLADLLARVFDTTCERVGLATAPPRLSGEGFRRPAAQGGLF